MYTLLRRMFPSVHTMHRQASVIIGGVHYRNPRRDSARNTSFPNAS